MALYTSREMLQKAVSGGEPKISESSTAALIDSTVSGEVTSSYSGSAGFGETRMADFYRYGLWNKTTTTGGITKYNEVYAPGSITGDTRASRETYSTIRVVKTTGEGDKKKDENIIPPYTKFILESVQEARQERSQIVETFGDFYVFFFGERPRMFTYTGTLVNARNVNWVYEFSYYYDTILRGTKCVEKGARIVFQYGNTVIEGYILNSSMGITADNEGRVPFSFTCVVLKRTDITKPEDFNKYSSLAQKMQEDTVRKILNQIAGKEGSGTSDQDTSNAFNMAKKALNGGPITNYF